MKWWIAYLPLFHHGPDLIGRNGHAMEIREDIFPTDVLRHQTELAESVVVLVKVRLGNFENASLQALRGDFWKEQTAKMSRSPWKKNEGLDQKKWLTCSLCSVDNSLPNVALIEHGRSPDVIPVLARERIDTVEKWQEISKKHAESAEDP